MCERTGLVVVIAHNSGCPSPFVCRGLADGARPEPQMGLRNGTCGLEALESTPKGPGVALPWLTGMPLPGLYGGFAKLASVSSNIVRRRLLHT